ncbi:MAG TPA: hypothetical protein VF665_15510 [Longimicrobium sp.]|jgi:hypothetical protein
MTKNTDSATGARIPAEIVLRWAGIATLFGLAAGLVIGISALSA